VKFLGKSWKNFTKNLFYTGRYDLSEILFQRPVEFPTAVARKLLTGWSCLIDHRKAEGVPFEMVFGTSRVSANPSLEIKDLFCRCSIQKQNTAAMLIVKIPYFLNHLADRVV
jgi:hypothetical protein